jgi:hypothetical protein
MAWWPGPAAETARVPCTLAEWSPRAACTRWRAGARAISPVVASRWQGITGELVETTYRTPGKVGAARGSPRWWRDDGAERRLGAATRGGVLAGGRVSGNSG